MHIKESRFVFSSPDVKKCPSPDLPEYAFIGRSNVGKSSLLNMLTGKKRIARTSSTPGKTRLINHFIINENWYLVDLPGYGYARVPKTIKQAWEQIAVDYILMRKNLMSLFMLIDSRLPPQKPDLLFLNFLGTHQVPFVILFTKSDKLNKQQLNSNLVTYQEQLKKTWEFLPPFITTSAIKKTGREEIISFIEKTNKLWKK